jgi:superfamily II DNA or RNA helicase
MLCIKNFAQRFDVNLKNLLYTQSAGRLHRMRADKEEVLIYDYVDAQVPMLQKMLEKRLKGYAKIGYVTHQEHS